MPLTPSLPGKETLLEILFFEEWWVVLEDVGRKKYISHVQRNPDV
jgi:hypothetical protein